MTSSGKMGILWHCCHVHRTRFVEVDVAYELFFPLFGSFCETLFWYPVQALSPKQPRSVPERIQAKQRKRSPRRRCGAAEKKPPAACGMPFRFEPLSQIYFYSFQSAGHQPAINHNQALLNMVSGGVDDYGQHFIQACQTMPTLKKKTCVLPASLPRYVAYLGINLQLEPELSWVARDPWQSHSRWR